MCKVSGYDREFKMYADRKLTGKKVKNREKPRELAGGGL